MNKPPEISIYVRSSLSRTLMDLRIGHRDLKFGKLGDVARQYGIKCTLLPNCFVFTGPKPRIRIFVEKLHFSRTPYSYKPI